MYVGALCPGPVNTEFNEVANVEFALAGITPEYCAGYALKQMKRRSNDMRKIYSAKSADRNYCTSAEEKAESRGHIKWKKLK